jgi:hypothetical protein
VLRIQNGPLNGAILVVYLAMPFSPVRPEVSLTLVCALASMTGFGEIDRVELRREVQDFSRAAIDRRFGPDYAFYHTNGVDEAFPEIWMAPSRQDPGGRRYQIGGPWTSDPGAYSSTQGQILFAPDDGEFGVDRVTILEWANGCFSERPEPPWWGGFRPEPASTKWRAVTESNPGVPVAMARGMGGWANCGVIVFSSGLVSAAGTATASGTTPTWKLPKEKIPTAVAITSKSEFALVTVTDVKRRRGQLAVFALQGGGNAAFVHDWRAKYPCLPSTAWLSGMKLLGYIDLPGIEFPTGVSATGNDENRWVFGHDGNVGMLNAWNLSKQSSRDSFRHGRNAGYVSTAGYAVVISKHENKAAFVDLQPLFKRVHDLYFTTPANLRKTRHPGRGRSQFPYSFSVSRSWRPRVTAIVDVAEPTAVLAGLSRGENARAYIASMDGAVGVYAVGGLATTARAESSQIIRVAETRVGRNPTCLAHQKLSRDTIIAVSRGDREIAWIKSGAESTGVIRRLRDARLSDPVFVEMADTHGIEASVITVADFHGRKIVNYRFSPVVFSMQGGAVFGMRPDGNAEFECGGILDFPGSPFCISAANVN